MVQSTGEVFESEPEHASQDEAIAAAGRYALANIAPDTDVQIIVHDAAGQAAVTRVTNTTLLAADKLRKNMDAAEYKHVVLGLIFLKYVSDAFEVLHSKLVKGEGEFSGADPEDPNEYTAEKVFFVPPIARWTRISDNARKTDILLDNGKRVDIGGYVDDAMEAIERQNTLLKGVLPIVYARQNLDRTSLSGLIDLIGTVALGTAEAQSTDVLGQVYEYFLGQFALAEGKKGGQFYTPRSVVRLLVEMLEPYEGRALDPCCGSGGMFASR